MKIRENVLISELTTMRIGGAARYVIEVTELSDISKALDFAKERELSIWFMGEGANTIGRDNGFDGVIIINKMRGIEIVSQTADEVEICAMGGENWDDLVAFACERGYSGIEALSKIPGSVGAAPVQNIGAYGQEISQVIESVEAYDVQTGELVVVGKEEMQMRYRSTIFNTGADAGRYFIVSVTLLLENEASLTPPFYNSLQRYLDAHNVTDYTPLAIREAVSAVRAEKLPDPKVLPSAGSFFKNIYLDDEEADTAEAQGIKVIRKNGENKISSGYLIEKAGLKGREFHGFVVSEKAALILINKNAKTYADLDAARSEIRKIVFDKFGYELEQEPVELAVSGDDISSNHGSVNADNGGDA